MNNASNTPHSGQHANSSTRRHIGTVLSLIFTLDILGIIVSIPNRESPITALYYLLVVTGYIVGLITISICFDFPPVEKKQTKSLLDIDLLTPDAPWFAPRPRAAERCVTHWFC